VKQTTMEAQQLSLFAIPTLEERLRARSEQLRGHQNDECLMATSPAEWVHVHCTLDKFVVAATCLRVHSDCEACYRFLTKDRG